MLADAGVEFIVVGGRRRRGAWRGPCDTRSFSSSPLPRGAPPGLPFLWDERTLQNGLNFTLATELGSLDLLGEITAGGGYDELKDRSMEIQVFGRRCRCINLDELIRVKRAAGRPKDYEAIAELEKLLELTQSTGDR